MANTIGTHSRLNGAILGLFVALSGCTDASAPGSKTLPEGERTDDSIAPTGTTDGKEPVSAMSNGTTDGEQMPPSAMPPSAMPPSAMPPSAMPQLLTAPPVVPAQLQQALTAAANTTAVGLLETYAAPVAGSLPYDASTATGLDVIQASSLALNESESAALAEHGLVISSRQPFPSFAFGYKAIYSEDLPLYVSADSILEALHRTFDTLLKETEQLVLVDELLPLLQGMRARIAGAFDDPQLTADTDLYLTMAESLLRGTAVAPQLVANQQQVTELLALATASEGHQNVELFGVSRDVDFSQFTPRGHYADSLVLRRYFQAMTWLGRIDLRLIETQGNGDQLFSRRQFDAAVALNDLMGEPERALWSHIDSTIGTFVGEHDSMTPADIAGLLSALEVNSLVAANSLSDAEIVAEIVAGGWGEQRIASRLIVADPGKAGALPLDRSFLLFGQRYTVDSHALVNVTDDRVKGRLMPKPLDVAFSALGNNAALPLLAEEFEHPGYVEGLATTRTLVDAHEPEYWQGSLYTRWLDALRSLSPQTELQSTSPQLSGITATAAWNERILSTQLASWAELRHDTILYVKQSFTSGNFCEFPNAYVDPYPEFYSKLGALAEAVSITIAELPDSAEELKQRAATWATLFKTVVGNLEEMANNQLSGAPHSEQLLDFINDAVNWDQSNLCGEVSYSNLQGWYLGLYFDEEAGLEYDPVVADVHTQPTDAGGTDVGRILHVGTGEPRLMVVTAETCSGPQAYAGVAFSYGELITQDWERLTDNDWRVRIVGGFPDVPWMDSVLAK